MKTILIAILTVIAIAIALIAGCYARAIRPQVQTISEPISADAFRLETGIKQLPTSASNIWYARSSVGLDRPNQSITTCYREHTGSIPRVGLMLRTYIQDGKDAAPHLTLPRYGSIQSRAASITTGQIEKESNNALLGTRHKWRVPRTLTFESKSRHWK